MSFLASTLSRIILSGRYINKGEPLKFQNLKILPLCKIPQTTSVRTHPKPVSKIKTLLPEKSSKLLAVTYSGNRIETRRVANSIAYEVFRRGTANQAGGCGGFSLRGRPRGKYKSTKSSEAGSNAGATKGGGAANSGGASNSGGAAQVSRDSCGNAKDPASPRTPSYGNDPCGMTSETQGDIPKFRYTSLCMLSLIGLYTGYLFTRDEDEIRREFIPYTYLYKRSKRFAWGDGQKSFFHGPNNFLADEENYEPKRRDPVKEEMDEKRRLRKQHAKEELERRKSRREYEKEFGTLNIRPWVDKTKCKE